jgi:hypothetical protein
MPEHAHPSKVASTRGLRALKRCTIPPAACKAQHNAANAGQSSLHGVAQHSTVGQLAGISTGGCIIQDWSCQVMRQYTGGVPRLVQMLLGPPAGHMIMSCCPGCCRCYMLSVHAECTCCGTCSSPGQSPSSNRLYGCSISGTPAAANRHTQPQHANPCRGLMR